MGEFVPAAGNGCATADARSAGADGGAAARPRRYHGVVDIDLAVTTVAAFAPLFAIKGATAQRSSLVLSVLSVVNIKRGNVTALFITTTYASNVDASGNLAI